MAKHNKGMQSVQKNDAYHTNVLGLDNLVQSLKRIHRIAYNDVVHWKFNQIVNPHHTTLQYYIGRGRPQLQFQDIKM